MFAVVTSQHLTVGCTVVQ